jgi:hypothetical protein
MCVACRSSAWRDGIFAAQGGRAKTDAVLIRVWYIVNRLSHSHGNYLGEVSHRYCADRIPFGHRHRRLSILDETQCMAGNSSISCSNCPYRRLTIVLTRLVLVLSFLLQSDLL